MNPRRRHLLLLAACGASIATLAACGGPVAALPQPAEIDPASTCDLDGMLLADYPGPKAQIHYADTAAPVFFCDTVEMFAMLLRPEQARKVRVAFTQDMARADWNQPRGHWFDAATGFYVVGSRRRGSMGPTIAGFASEAGAQAFAAQFGGRAMPFASVTPEMVDLGGGALHDAKM